MNKNYEDFRISMGKLAIGINKSFKLNLTNKDKTELTNEFIRINEKFEDLFQKNIMKDAYTWK